MQSGKEVRGVVIAMEPKTGRNQCDSRATIEYTVAGTPYKVLAKGCGAAADGLLRLGYQARVVYLSSSPAVAEAYAPGVSTQRPGWGLLFGLWLLAAVTSLVTWRSFRSASPRTPNAA